MSYYLIYQSNKMFEIIKILLHGIRVHTNWLHYVLFEYNLLYYDLWSFIHLLSGALLFMLFTAYGVKNRWQKLLISVSIFELIEAFLFIAVLRLFHPEKIIDVFNDILIGMLGGVMVYYIYEKAKIHKYHSYFTSFFAAIFIAFVWTGSYGYQYNNSFFNSEGINWWAFLLWFITGFFIVRGFESLKKLLSVSLSSLCIWITYFILLLLVEYIGYDVLKLHEFSQNSIKTPLLFNLIHGNFSLHLFYLIAPFVFLGFYYILNKIVIKYEQQTHILTA